MHKKIFVLAIFAGFISSSKAQLISSIADSIMANSNNIPYISNGITFLPDGSGIDYTSTLTHTVFGAGDTIQNASDISSICMNVEHSYIGDLTIKIECPSGKQALLANLFNSGAGGSGNTFLGEALDDQSSSPGTGWNYCFSESALWGTLDSENINQNWDTSTITPGNNILASGLFQLDESLDSLVGCPLNGDWSIIITDNMVMDDGYIFSWQLNFDTIVFPAGYNVGRATVIASGGVPPYNYFWSNGATTSSVNRLAPGTYTVQITDSDTTQKRGGRPNKTFSTVVITEGTITTVKVNLDDQFSIYPNPVAADLNVSFNQPNEKSLIKIYNLSGVLLHEEKLNNKKSIQIDFENYPQGIYFVKIQNNDETITKKIIKK